MIKKVLLFITIFSFIYFGTWYFWGEELLFEAGMELILEEIERDETGFYANIIKDKEVKVISKKRISRSELKLIPHEYQVDSPSFKLEAIKTKEKVNVFYETVVRKTPWEGKSSKLVGFEIHIEENNGVLGILDLQLLPYSDTSNYSSFLWAIFGWIPIRNF